MSEFEIGILRQPARGAYNQKIQRGEVMTRVPVGYLRFYRSLNRFRLKSFLPEALSFWGYAARQCIIDNTNLARRRIDHEKPTV